MNENVWPLILLGGGLLAFLLAVSFLSKNYSLNNFKNKTVGDGQHGTARWATPREIHTTYHVVPFRPRRWRKGEELPTVQGIILGGVGGRKRKSKGGSLLQTSRKLLEKLHRPTAGKKEKRKPKKKKSAISKIKNVVEDQLDVRALVEKAHSLGIRVLLDGVFNHISSRHFLFQDVLRNGMASNYYSCFYRLPEKPKLPAPGELPEYTCFSYVADMPKTNTADPYLRQYFCDVGVYWIREFDIDGWRLDVANELDDGFLRAFRTAVKAAKPDAVIVGEVWENAAHYLNGDMMDSAMNYDFRRYCRRFFAEETVDAETFDTNVSTLLLRYRENALFAQLNLLDSHDVSRYLSLCGENVDKMELSVLLQMTFPGMPCVFYGDEKGLCGLSESEYRQAMAWGKSHPLEDVYRCLISLRKAHPALRYGDFVTNFAAGKTYSYSRNWENTRITVTMNLGDAPIPAPQRGRLLLKKGGNHAIIGAWEYEVREERIHGGDDL